MKCVWLRTGSAYEVSLGAHVDEDEVVAEADLLARRPLLTRLVHCPPAALVRRQPAFILAAPAATARTPAGPGTRAGAALSGTLTRVQQAHVERQLVVRRARRRQTRQVLQYVRGSRILQSIER